jgi:hypothetical protein
MPEGAREEGKIGGEGQGQGWQWKGEEVQCVGRGSHYNLCKSECGIAA